jgi:methyl-accepting chemotaxis protein
MISTDTKKNAQQGAIIVENALKSINEVQEVSLALKSDMYQLDEHAQSISKIMDVISDIADQTNLLALNAAIEAARAGDAGRGFAVVADEVRKLAEKTVLSTNDVGNAIKAIQESTSKSLKSMDSAIERVATATTFANQSGDALRRIVQDADASADQVSAIATASEEQSAASEEINHSIVEVSVISNQTAEAMGKASKSVEDLAIQSRTLSDLIIKLKSH